MLAHYNGRFSPMVDGYVYNLTCLFVRQIGLNKLFTMTQNRTPPNVFERAGLHFKFIEIPLCED